MRVRHDGQGDGGRRNRWKNGSVNGVHSTPAVGATEGISLERRRPATHRERAAAVEPAARVGDLEERADRYDAQASGMAHQFGHDAPYRAPRGWVHVRLEIEARLSVSLPPQGDPDSRRDARVEVPLDDEQPILEPPDQGVAPDAPERALERQRDHVAVRVDLQVDGVWAHAGVDDLDEHLAERVERLPAHRGFP